MPCTAGRHWQRINSKFPGIAAKHNMYCAEFHAKWKLFVEVSKLTFAKGQYIVCVAAELCVLEVGGCCPVYLSA